MIRVYDCLGHSRWTRLIVIAQSRLLLPGPTAVFVLSAQMMLHQQIESRGLWAELTDSSGTPRFWLVPVGRPLEGCSLLLELPNIAPSCCGYNSIRNGPLKQMHSENTSQIPQNGQKSDSPTLQLLRLLLLLLLFCLFTHRISTWQYLFITFEFPFPWPEQYPTCHLKPKLRQVLVHVQPFTWRLQLESRACLSKQLQNIYIYIYV